jgi:glycogen debranching enzyme
VVAPNYDDASVIESGQAVDIRDVQVIKHDRTFFLCDRWGDVPEPNAAALGLYHRDTRFLSRLELTLNDLRPLLLHSSTERNYSQNVELVFPVHLINPEGTLRRENISLSRYRVLAETLIERIRVANYGRERRDIRVTLRFAADFQDLFEVRGIERPARGQAQQPRVERGQVSLSYRGLDGVVRATNLRFSPLPSSLTESEATFEFALDPGAESEIGVEIAPQVGDGTPVRRPVREAQQEMERQYSQWRKRCTRFRSTPGQLSRFLDQAILDLKMLTATDDRGGSYIDAGVPWFCALFGRDSLITAYQYLGVNPDLAWGTLRGLAALQGTKEDEWREEEPGKILHEVRVGEMAGTGEIPHTPYYGSIDATPLWLITYAYAYGWTADLEAARELWPNALACLEWIDRYGDVDGDGYLEYRRRSERGLDNQGWKDSFDAVVHPDGALAEPPIALVEVQGYAYDAKRRTAVVARALGEEGVAERLEKEAAGLKERFNRDFWVESEGYYALALDGRKRQVTTVTSNPGQALWSNVVDAERAPRVARKLLSSQMASGWGIRTLGTRQTPYDPIGYHTGTVWPHDNSLIAHGLKRYGLDRESMRVIDQLSACGVFFPRFRYPELFCGFSSEEVPVPVEYPVACRPQAWASGAPLLMLRSYGGISADAPNGVLYIVRPQLPSWLEEIEILGMRVGKARVDLTFTRQDGMTAVQVVRKEGDLEILIRQ